jgi:hypothetical protein
MKKRKVKNRSHNNRLMYTLITLGILAVVAVGVYAYGTSNPSVFGHTATEMNIDIDGDGTPDKTLQEAFDDGDLGGSSWPKEIKLTNATHNGDFGGYNEKPSIAGMYEWIQDNGCEGFHVCTADEISVAFQKGMISGYQGGWFDGGHCEEPASGRSLDCYGWQTSTSEIDNVVGSEGGSSGSTGPAFQTAACSSSHFVWCCK